jgi:AraC family transcriptional regulator
MLGRHTLGHVIRRIHADRGAVMPVSALADECGMTRAHFSREFHRLIGMPPHHFVMRSRVELAKHLLVRDGYAISRVAMETGFADQSHLARMMKRCVGVSPGAYQAMAAQALSFL